MQVGIGVSSDNGSNAAGSIFYAELHLSGDGSLGVEVEEVVA